MADFDPYSMLMGDDPSAEEQSRAYAAALRGQRQQADVQGQLGMLASMTGNSVLSKTGAALSGNAEQQQQQISLGQQLLEKAGQNRLERRTQGQHWDQQAGWHQDEIKRQSERDAADLDYKNRALQQEKFKPAYDPATGRLIAVNTLTGQGSPLDEPTPGAPLLGGRGGGKGPSLDKLAKDFDHSMSASGARAGPMGKDYERLQNAQNLKTIIAQPKVSPQMVTEATAALGKLISGGVVTEGTMEAMVPHTAGMDLARKMQYVFGHPQDAGVGEFLEYMGHTADREAGNATQRIHTERLARLGSHGAYFTAGGEQMARAAARYGLSPDDLKAAFTGEPVAAAAPGPSAQTEGLPSGAVWLRSKADGGKTRIMGTPDGKPMPGAKSEPNPNYKPPAVATNG